MICLNNKLTDLLFFLGVIAIFAISCDTIKPIEEFTNEEDPQSKDFIPPEIIIDDAPDDGTVIHNHQVHFQWHGNKTEMQFSINTNNQGWSPWSSIQDTTYEYLDESEDTPYTFQVKSRYLSEVQSDPSPVINYFIDAIQGPAFKFFPRRKMTNVNALFPIDVMVEEVNDLSGVKIVLKYDRAFLEVGEIRIFQDYRSIFKSNNGNVIPFVDPDSTNVGQIKIEVGVVGGNPIGVDGTGKIGTVFFKAIRKGETELTFSSQSNMRDPDNKLIQINAKVSSRIEID